MGKKSAPEAPDYGPLIAASEKSAQYSYEIAKRQQDFFEKIYAENKEIGDKVIDFAMDRMETQSEWADADRRRYENIYQPLEDQAAKRAEDFASVARQEFEAGKAEADVAAQFAQARDVAAQRLEAYGVDPSQTRAGGLDTATRVAEAAAQAGAGNQARMQTEMYGDQLTANAINTGKGYPAQTLAAAGQAGQFGQQGVNTGLAGATSAAQTMGTGYQWQGMGNQGTGLGGQLMNAQFQNELSAFDAEQQASSGWMKALGLAASFLPKPAWAEGGAIPDESGAMSASTPTAAPGGAGIPDQSEPQAAPMGQMLSPEMSPSRGAITDDINYTLPDGSPAKLNAGEFIVPKDVVGWLGEKGMQDMILKARKGMGNPQQRPAQPQVAPPPAAQGSQAQLIPPRGIGAIPDNPMMGA